MSSPTGYNAISHSGRHQHTHTFGQIPQAASVGVKKTSPSQIPPTSAQCSQYMFQLAHSPSSLLAGICFWLGLLGTLIDICAWVSHTDSGRRRNSPSQTPPTSARCSAWPLQKPGPRRLNLRPGLQPPNHVTQTQYCLVPGWLLQPSLVLVLYLQTTCTGFPCSGKEAREICLCRCDGTWLRIREHPVSARV